MAILETGSASANGDSAAPSITHGLTINSGDVVVIFINSNGTPTCADNNGANPFVEAWDAVGAGTSQAQAVYTRVAGASEPATYSFTLSVGGRWSLICRVFSGVDNTTVWDNAPAVGRIAGGGAGTTLTAPSMTTLANGAMGLIFCGIDAGTGTFSGQTNGYITEVETGANNPAGSYIREWATAGATGTTAVTSSVDTGWDIMQVALNPAAGGPTPSITSINGGADITSGDTGVVIVGTDFEVSQGTGGVTQEAIAVTETAWSDTSITINTITIENEVARYGSNDFIVTNNTGNSDTLAATVVPPLGYDYVNLVAPLATAGARLTAIADLAGTDQVRYQDVLWQGGSPTSYTVLVNSDGSFDIGNGPVTDGSYTFNARAEDGTGWGTAADQTVTFSGGVIVDETVIIDGVTVNFPVTITDGVRCRNATWFGRPKWKV